MSLRAFHILFIALSVVMTAVVGGWGVERYLEAGSRSGLAIAATFVAGGVLLVVYGSRYFKKLRELER